MLVPTALALFGVALVAALIQRTVASFSGHSKDLHGLSSPAAAILPYSPNTLDWYDLLTIVVDLLRKYLPGKSPKLQPAGAGFKLPRLHVGGVLRLSRKDYENFQKALPKSSEQVVPPGNATNPLFLVSVTTPLLLILLSHPNCPIKALGAVNTRNRFSLVDVSLCRDATSLIAASKNVELTFTAAMGGEELPGRRKRRGVEFEIVIDIMHKGAVVMRQEMSFLQFLSKATKPVYSGPDESRTDAELNSPGPKLRIPADAPRKYASCSKDFNPIHTSSLAAKLFGFPSAIAHGNHILILAAQALVPSGEGDSASPAETKAQSMVWTEPKSVTLEAVFVKPVTPLPLDLVMSLGDPKTSASTGLAFGLSKGAKLCVSGTIRQSS